MDGVDDIPAVEKKVSARKNVRSQHSRKLEEEKRAPAVGKRMAGKKNQAITKSKIEKKRESPKHDARASTPTASPEPPTLLESTSAASPVPTPTVAWESVPASLAHRDMIEGLLPASGECEV